MTEPSEGGGRRPATDPGYARLEDFKRDLRQITLIQRPDGVREFPSFRTVTSRAALGSTSTVHKALTATDTTMTSEDTVRRIARHYDPSALDYWLARRQAVQSARADRAAIAAVPAPDDAATPGQVDQAEDEATHESSRGLLGSLTGRTWTVIGGAALAAIVISAFALNGDPDGDEQVDTPSDSAAQPSDSPSDLPSDEGVAPPIDYSDPNAAGCVEAGSERLRNEPVEAVGGLVSLVYSAACDAYWARAERTDGQEIGNRIDLKLTPRGSDRTPVTANDADAPVVYTYLLTGGDATAFCVDAAFWVGEESFGSPRFCVDKQ